MSTVEIKTVCDQAYADDALKNVHLNVGIRTLQKDVAAIQAANMVSVTSLTAEEMAAMATAEYEAERRELWTVIRGCSAKEKHVKVSALRTLAYARTEHIKHMQKLGILPEVPVKEELLRWIMGLAEEEMESLLAASDEDLLERYYSQRTGRLKLA